MASDHLDPGDPGSPGPGSGAGLRGRDLIGLGGLLVGAVVGGMLVGLLVDHLAGTSPAGVLVGVLVGVVAACAGFVVRVRAALRS